MYLSGVGCALPTQQISNHELLELVAYYSRRGYEGDLDALLSTITAKLRRIGIATRFWRATKERPIELLREACEGALRQANLGHHDVDFVIYAGVDRGFAEPANACFIAKELGMNRARTFDIADACLGWCTATEVAQALFTSAPSAVALVVNGEFPMRLGGAVLPGCFAIGSEAELAWKFPAFTLGEAATATILVGEGAAWQYVHESHNQFADLCTVGFGASADYAGPSARLESSGTQEFRAYGRELTQQTVRPAIRVLRELLSRTSHPRSSVSIGSDKFANLGIGNIDAPLPAAFPDDRNHSGDEIDVIIAEPGEFGDADARGEKEFGGHAGSDAAEVLCHWMFQDDREFCAREHAWKPAR